MTEEKASTVKVKFEIEFENVDEANRLKLLNVHEDVDVTKMVRSLLDQAEDMSTYTKVIWGQWQQIASS